MASDRAVTVAVVGGIFALAAAAVPVVLGAVLSNEGAASSGSPPSVTIPDGRFGEAGLFLNKESAPVGGTVLVIGRGFGAGETVEILIGASVVGTTRTGPGGDFANVAVQVPAFFRPFSKPMQVDVHATGRSTITSARAPFTIA